LFAPGTVLQMEQPAVDATWLLENDFYAKKVLDLSPIHYYPVLDNNSANVADFGSIPINGVIGGYKGAPALGETSIEAPVRKYRETSIGFAVERNVICQVSFPSDKSFDQLFNYNRTGTLIYWIRSVHSTSHNIQIAVMTNPSSGTAHWRMYNGHAHMPDNTNTVQIPGYANGDNKIYMVAVRRSGPSNISVFANGQWRTTIGAPNATQPNAGATGQFKFPAFFDWNYYGIRGVISDVAMFDRALSDHEIETLYEIGKLDD
jgi:hypothetical protein